MPIEISDQEVKAGLARLVAAGANPRPFLASIGNVLADSARLRFTESRAPDGSRWAPLSPVTLALRRGHGGGAQPLLDTGATRNSITSVVGSDYVEVGTNKRQAAMLHFGAKRGQFGRGKWRTRRGSFPIPWGDVPSRKFLGVSREDKGEIVAILRETFTADK